MGPGPSTGSRGLGREQLGTQGTLSVVVRGLEEELGRGAVPRVGRKEPADWGGGLLEEKSLGAR